MFCTSCGKEISNDIKFCPYCGKPVNSNNINSNQGTYTYTAPIKNQKKKKPFYLKWWFILIVVFLLIGIIGAIGGSGSKNETGNKSDNPIPSSTDEAIKQSNGNSIENSFTQSESEQTIISSSSESSEASESSDVVSVDTIVTLIKSTISSSSDGFSYFDVAGDDTGITITLAVDGLSYEIFSASVLGYDENYEPWKEAKDSMLYFYESVEELVKTLGRDDLVITMNLVNDQNYDNSLLLIYEGVIIYDVLAQ